MKSIKTEFRKILTSKGFYLCIFFTFFLFLFAEIYIDPITMNRYSVIRSLTDFTAEERIKTQEMCNITVLEKVLSGWITLFVPIIAAFCFVPMICAEREANAVRFEVFRSGKAKFSSARFLAGTLSGGTAVLIGYLLFSAVIMLLFPGINQFDEITAEFISNSSAKYPELLCGLWFYGIFWGIPAMFLTSVIRNKYLIMCIPFFVKYGLSQLSASITSRALTNGQTGIITRIAGLFSPERLLHIGYYPQTELLIVFGGFTAVFFTAYLIITLKRGDSGA